MAGEAESRVLHGRQPVDFLRRRYASAILSGDHPTASRLRAQLDQVMNPSANPSARADPTGPAGEPGTHPVLPGLLEPRPTGAMPARCAGGES